MLSAKKLARIATPAILIAIFLLLPTYVYLTAKPFQQEVSVYDYKFNEITAEGYPAIIDMIKKEAGYEDSETNPLSLERNFIPGSQAWSFKLDEQFITVFLFSTDKAATEALSGFSLKGYKYLDPVTKESARLLWETRPDFYSKENVLVVYAGQSKDLGRIIKKYLGDAKSVPSE